MVPSMEKRILMNYILLAGTAPTVGILGGAYIDFFIPRTPKGGEGGTLALDRNGDVVKLTSWK